MPNAATQPLYDEAARLGIGFCLGYALLETTPDGIQHRWNVMTLVDRQGQTVLDSVRGADKDKPQMAPP